MENDLTFIESVLTLYDVGSEDAGNYYSCTVNNSIGSAESSFTLHIKPNSSYYSLCMYNVK